MDTWNKWSMSLLLSVVVLSLLSCGGGGGGSDSTPSPINITLEKYTAPAGSLVKVYGLDLESCPLQNAEIRVGGELAPAVLDEHGEVEMLVPIFYDEAAEWSVPPSEAQNVEIYCDGSLLDVLTSPLTVKTLVPAPGTTEIMIDDYAQIVADLKQISSMLLLQPGAQEQVVISLISALEEFITGSSQDCLPAMMESLSQNHPEVLAIMDSINTASGTDASVSSFQRLLEEMTAELGALPIMTPSGNDGLVDAGYREPTVEPSLRMVSAAPIFTIETPFVLSDDILARQLQAYSVLNDFAEQVLSNTASGFSTAAGAASIIFNRIPYVTAVELGLFLIDYQVRLFFLSAIPASLEEMELTVADPNLENLEITRSTITLHAKNNPAPIKLTDLTATIMAALGIGGLADDAIAWVKTWEEKLQKLVLNMINWVQMGMDHYANENPAGIQFDLALFALVPQMYFEAVGTTRDLYYLQPDDSSVIAPLMNELEWRASDNLWGTANLLVRPATTQAARRWGSIYTGGAFGDFAVTQSNMVPVSVGELTLDVELHSFDVPEGGEASVGVRLSNAPQEGDSISVEVEHASGDTDLSLISVSPLRFDSTNWNLYQYVTVAAAEDDDLTHGSATITLRATLDGGTVVMDTISVTERDNDGASFITSTNEIAVLEGGLVLFYVSLSEEPEAPVTATVIVSSGDPDIVIESNNVLLFDASNWDRGHSVALYAEPDDDIINGTTMIQISTETPGITAAFVTAIENEIIETSLYVNYEFWNKYGMESFSGSVPVTIITSQDGLQVIPILDVDAVILRGCVNYPLWSVGCGNVAVTVDNYAEPIWYDPVDIWYDNTSVTPYYLSDYPNSLAIEFEFRYFIEYSPGNFYTESFSSNFLLPAPEFLYEREYADTEEGGRGGGYWRIQLLQP